MWVNVSNIYRQKENTLTGLQPIDVASIDPNFIQGWKKMCPKYQLISDIDISSVAFQKLDADFLENGRVFQNLFGTVE